MATVARTVSVSANAGLLIQAVFQIRSGQRRLASGAVSRICVNVGTTCWANSLERLIKGEMILSLIRLLVNLEVGVNVVFGNNRGQKRCCGAVMDEIAKCQFGSMRLIQVSSSRRELKLPESQTRKLKNSSLR